MRHRSDRHLHYSWIIAILTFFLLLVTAGVRSTSSVLFVPLEQAFGWSSAIISTAMAINLTLFGLTGPFAGALFERFGIKPVVIIALLVTITGVGLTTQITAAWQLVLCWGVLVGLGTGVITPVLGMTVVNRWFLQRRGLVMGCLTASSATGQLLFLPLLVSLATHYGWQAVTWLVIGLALLLIPVVTIIMREWPADMGLRPYGDSEHGQVSNISLTRNTNALTLALQVFKQGAHSRDFWLLFLSFSICGISSIGLIGTHLIPTCVDHGIPTTRAAGMLASMAVLDLIGTTLSGWLSDRYDNRVLLAWYYGLRGLSLLYLPYAFDSTLGLGIFVVFYGLDWFATVPPTVRLLSQIFGVRDGNILFGWLLAGHQIGAGLAAASAGVIRTYLERYLEAYITVGFCCLLAAGMALMIKRSVGAPPATSGVLRQMTS